MCPVKSKPEVCVIGAGVCGIVSIKCCLEQGFRVTCYDKSPNYGGLWRYQDAKTHENGEFIPSVMRTTILNTSKELSAFSDYPPPAHLPNFMKQSLYMDYIESYVQHFKLRPHMHLEHEILHCRPERDEQTGELRWSVDVLDVKENRKFTRLFDKLMVAVGHHNIPHVPAFPGQHLFKGQVIHSARLKDILGDGRFAGKNVVVVGFGNSACDAANDLAMVTNKCYVSCHRGNWFLSRLTPKGSYDHYVKRRWNYYRAKFVPESTIDRRFIKILERQTNHELLGLKPKHQPSEHVPTINDLFPYRVYTGGISLKAALSRFTEKGVVFDGEPDTEYAADVVVLATGYVARIPFLDEYQLGLKSAEHDEYELFFNMFAPKLSPPDRAGWSDEDQSIRAQAISSIAFIGFVQPAGSILVVSELQARLVALVFGGKKRLPSVEAMMDHTEMVRARRSHAIRSHSRDQLVGDWIGYLDELADLLGVRPNMSRLFFKDFALWKQLMFGLSVPYQYRLEGPGSWEKARETIMRVDERLYQGINEGKNHILFQARRKCLREHQQQHEAKD